MEDEFQHLLECLHVPALQKIVDKYVPGCSATGKESMAKLVAKKWMELAGTQVPVQGILLQDRTFTKKNLVDYIELWVPGRKGRPTRQDNATMIMNHWLSVQSNTNGQQISPPTTIAQPPQEPRKATQEENERKIQRKKRKEDRQRKQNEYAVKKAEIMQQHHARCAKETANLEEEKRKYLATWAASNEQAKANRLSDNEKKLHDLDMEFKECHRRKTGTRKSKTTEEGRQKEKGKEKEKEKEKETEEEKEKEKDKDKENHGHKETTRPAESTKRKQVDEPGTKEAGAPLKKVKTEKKKDPYAPKRNITAYMQFRKDWCAKHPNTVFIEGTKLAAAEWNSISEGEKAKFTQLASLDEERYKVEVTAYAERKHTAFCRYYVFQRVPPNMDAATHQAAVRKVWDNMSFEERKPWLDQVIPDGGSLG